MKPIRCGEWMVDLENCTCRNIENEMVISFEKRGTTLLGKFKKIPIKLVQEWMQYSNWEKYVKKAIIDADEVFFKVYFASEIQKKYQNSQPTS
jgi:hypothetical protein